jgi:hypothetical protein
MVALNLTVNAQQLSDQAHKGSISQSETAALNDRMASHWHWAEASFAVAGAAALGGLWLVLGPRGSIQPTGTFGGNSGTVGLAGDF